MSSNNKWSNEEIEFLKNNKDKGIEFLISNLSKTRKQIIRKAYNIKIKILINRRKITKELIESVIKKCFNYSDVCRLLNKSTTGGSYELIRNRIKEYNLDISHFTFKNTRIQPYVQKNKTKEEILVDNNMYRLNNKTVKRALLESGFIYCCSNCKLTEWNGLPISLDIDHIDGNWKNYTKENLRFLCPNCHRQTNTFGAKNIKKVKKIIPEKTNFKKITTEKNKVKKIKTKIGREHLRKVKDRPNIDVLLQNIQELGYCGTGRLYGVSDNAVRKWIKF
jgi:5-methylcytosine-specific restriction endonuclease McrA